MIERWLSSYIKKKQKHLGSSEAEEYPKTTQPKRWQSPRDTKSLQALRPVQRKARGYNDSGRSS